MATTDGFVRTVCIQFRFSNENVIPEGIMRTRQEAAEQTERSPGTGKEVVPTTEDCSMEGLLDQLEANGFHLVSAFAQERIAKDKGSNRKYWMVRFLFAQESYLDLTTYLDYKEEYQEDHRLALEQMCKEALWRCLAYNNPFYEDGEQVPGQRSISVNLAARKPLFTLTGEPVKVWQKNAEGKRIGDGPEFIKPAMGIWTNGQTIQAVPVIGVV